MVYGVSCDEAITNQSKVLKLSIGIFCDPHLHLIFSNTDPIYTRAHLICELFALFFHCTVHIRTWYRTKRYTLKRACALYCKYMFGPMLCGVSCRDTTEAYARIFSICARCAELGKHFFTRTLSVLSQILNIRGCTVAPKLIFRPKLWQERRLFVSSSCDRLPCPCVCRSTHSRIIFIFIYKFLCYIVFVMSCVTTWQ